MHHCHDETCSHKKCCSCKPGETCGCQCHHGQEHGHFSDQLLGLADEAWMELLKEKIKQKIQETTGQHLDQLASLVATANHNRWNSKMELMKNKEDFEAKLGDFFGS